MRPRILVLASGDAEGGGSGFQELVEFTRTVPPVLDAEIVAVVSHHQYGGVSKRAKKLGITFEYWPGPFTAERYLELVKKYHADFVMCSGWIKFVRGLDPRIVVNIHPAPLPTYGGSGWYGHVVHERVMEVFQREEITQSAVCMHFVDPLLSYDAGPVFFHLPILMRKGWSIDDLKNQVNEKERAWQAFILNLVVHRIIYLEAEGGVWRVRCKIPQLMDIIPGLKQACTYPWPKGG